jgi:FtsP/CotA-like multicopper oxidase with cupredoxin domain
MGDAIHQPVLYPQNDSTIQLTADVITKTVNGHQYTMYGYNRQIPGPRLVLHQGDTIKVNFTNHLPEPATIHWHGLRQDYHDDGVPDISQAPVPPDSSFLYTVHVPDEGIFWYHPHLREDRQQNLGLYGNILVEPRNDSYNHMDKEEFLMLNDLRIDRNGNIVPYGEDAANFALMGRYGNVLLINGDTNYSLNVTQGETVRLYLTNAANARPMNISIDGAQLKLVGSDNGRYEHEQPADSVVLGPAERAIVEATFNTPGEHAIRHTDPFRTYTLGSIAVQASNGSAQPSNRSAQMGNGSAQAGSVQRVTLHNYPDVIKDIDRFRPYFNKSIDRTFILYDRTGDTDDDKAADASHGMGGGMMGGMMSGMNGGRDGTHSMTSGMHSMMDGMGGGMHGMMDWMHGMMNGMHGMMSSVTPDGIEWEDTMPMMNQMRTASNTRWVIKENATGAENEEATYQFNTGDVAKIRIVNDASRQNAMDHMMHLHGQRFLVLDQNGMPNNDLAWKDTVLVPAGSYVDIFIDASNPGIWMFHCHINEHLEADMKTTFIVG